MAYIKNFWFHDIADDRENRIARVTVGLHPSGEVQLKWVVPKPFWDAMLRMAQAEADSHEAKMQAHLLGERYEEPTPTNKED